MPLRLESCEESPQLNSHFSLVASTSEMSWETTRMRLSYLLGRRNTGYRKCRIAQCLSSHAEAFGIWPCIALRPWHARVGFRIRLYGLSGQHIIRPHLQQRLVCAIVAWRMLRTIVGNSGHCERFIDGDPCLFSQYFTQYGTHQCLTRSP